MTICSPEGARILYAGEQLIGARAFRVIFAAISLPLATLALVHFINHRYDGLPLWNLRGQPFVHETVWIFNFISFLFLYPSTFNLLEVCADTKSPPDYLLSCPPGCVTITITG